MENTDCIKKIYLVGGAVRDALLRLPVKDKDYVAVGFCEEDFNHLQRVGKSFPVFLQKDGTQIALARKETKIRSGYNGFSTQTYNVSLYEDLQRRDLTINAIAFDESEKIHYDPFGGIEDLKNKILRHVSERFCEDPLRVLRIARFRARFGIEWKIHSSTKVLIYKMREELRFLEKNRTYKEIEEVFLHENSYLFFDTLFELGVLDVIFPHIYALTTLKEGNLHHLESSVFAHTMQVLFHTELQIKCQNLCDTNALLVLKFAALYHDIAKPYCYRHFGNSNDHDNPKLVCQYLDIEIPKALQRRMLILIQNHIKIYYLQEMRPSKIVKFFESYKRDSTLLKLQISLLIADKLGRTTIKTQEEGYLQPQFHNALLQLFDDLNAYSPKAWLEENARAGIQRSPTSIQMHILREKIKITQAFLRMHLPTLEHLNK